MKKYFKTLTLTVFATLLGACGTLSTIKQEPVDKIIAELNKPDSDYVVVIAHRADWRNHPENSISSIKSCIEMGVDMVELDVRKTKDGVFVLLHDGSVNRTTNGSGRISSLTLAEVKKLRLKANQGRNNAKVTDETVPTLEEALKVCKGRIMINIDKAGISPELLKLMKKTGTTKQILFKSSASVDSINKTLKKYKDEAKEIHFMPVVRGDLNKVKSYLDLEVKPKAAELVFSKADSPFNKEETLREIRKLGMRPWVNTLWDSLCAGQTDNKAHKDPEVWGNLIKKGYNMIQTDRPEELLKYLNDKNLHTLN